MMQKDPGTLLVKPDPSVHEVMNKTMNRFFDGFRQSCTLFAAIDLELFDRTKEPMTASELAENLRIDGKLSEPFFEILVGMGLLSRDEGRYVNTKVSDLYLTRGSPFSQLTNLGQASRRLKRWTTIEASLRSQGDDAGSDMFTEKWITAIGEGAIGGEISDTIGVIGRYVDLAQMSSLMDIGGGHALYAIAFKHKFPNLECSLFDQAMITPVARKNIECYGVEVSVQEGDFYQDEIRGTYDVVFSSYNRSGMDPAMAPIVGRLVRPGGFIIIKRPTMQASDPMRFIEWGLITRPGASESGKPRTYGDFDEYLEAMEKMNVAVVSREMLGPTTEMIVLRKAGV